jgi:hypothetical protein
MKTGVTIVSTTEEYPLYQMYPQQCNPQGAYIYLDPEDSELSADWSGEVGNSIPESVFHGILRRYPVSPYLSASEINKLMEELKPLALRVCEGYEKVWNGNNHVGSLTDDASEADEEMERLCRDEESNESHDGTEPWYCE